MFLNLDQLYYFRVINADNTDLDLTSASSVTVRFTNPHKTIEKTATITSATEGKGYVSLLSSDLTVSGIYTVVIIVNLLNGTRSTHPSDNITVTSPPSIKTLAVVSGLPTTLNFILSDSEDQILDLTGRVLNFYTKVSATATPVTTGTPLIVDAVNGKVSVTFTPIQTVLGYWVVDGISTAEVRIQV